MWGRLIQHEFTQEMSINNIHLAYLLMAILLWQRETGIDP